MLAGDPMEDAVPGEVGGDGALVIDAAFNIDSAALGGVVSAGGGSSRLAQAVGSGVATSAEEWQMSSRRPQAVAGDAMLMVGAAQFFVPDARSLTAGLGAFLITGLLFGLWTSRSLLDVQGVRWYAKVALVPVAATGAVLAATGQTRAASAAAAFAALVALLAVHSALWLGLALYRRSTGAAHPALLIGSEDQTVALERRLEVYPEVGLRATATFDPSAVPFASGAELVDRLIEQYRPAAILCATTDGTEAVFKDLVAFAAGRVQISLMMPQCRMAPGWRRIGDLGYLTVRSAPAWGADAVKRAMDVVLSALLLLGLSPVLAVAALAVRLDSPGPVLFKQRRVGYRCQPFEIYKFRSMYCNASEDSYLDKAIVGGLTFKVRNDPRVTRVGRIIRRLSIDELPQLFNVLKGEMSLVGPRPLAFALEDYDLRGRRRFRVRPGITGLWQVSGANALDEGDMVDLDLGYAANHTLAMDMVLLAKTIPAVLVRRAPV